MKLFSRRYRRLVPPAQRQLIADHRLPLPNWFVGAAEQPLVPRDPALVEEIEAVKARIRRRRQNEQGESVAAPVDAPVEVSEDRSAASRRS